MDEFLALVGVQAMRYAVRSGIALTSTYALGQCSRLLKTVEDNDIIAELRSLRMLLDTRIKIISPAIDLIEFRSGRGNVFLESAAPLAKSLHQEIVSLGRQIELVASAKEEVPPISGRFRVTQQHRDRLLGVTASIKQLLERIDREIPLFQLAISASGESLSTSLPTGISPSRLLQASTFLIIGDTQFAQDPSRPVQIGPAFTLSLYMLFLGHSSHQSAATKAPGTSFSETSKRAYGLGDGDRKPLWQEVLHKARVRLCRMKRDYAFDVETGYRPGILEADDLSEGGSSYGIVGGGDEYAYHLEIIEDLDDGRVHDEEKLRPYDDIANAGIRESLPIYQLSKIFYTDTGRILNIGDTTAGDNNPVLLLKRDIHAAPPNRTEGLVAHYLENVDDEDDVSAGSQHVMEACDQNDVDNQLLHESTSFKLDNARNQTAAKTMDWGFPSHLDPEWIALEVFEEEEEDDVVGHVDDDSESATEDGQPRGMLQGPGHGRHRSSLDSRMIDQIKKLSLRPSTTTTNAKQLSRQQPQDLATDTTSMRDFVARSPFGTITTSLSLMEMLIRLTSLQEVQQASHLSIPDHILAFFLEETSTTGLVGESQSRARGEAKRRMGFDPYTDVSESQADVRY